MGRYQSNIIKGKGTHFTWEERLFLHHIYNRSKIHSPKELANLLGKNKRTIQREIKRGWETFTASDLSSYQTYSPDIAQRKAEENLRAKGPDLKLGRDFEMARDISRKINNEHFSPDAVIMYYEKKGWPTSTRISTRTLYRYIEEGLIPDVSPNDLLRKGKRSKHGMKGPKKHTRAISARKSISNRPEGANSREIFGHWEMDCIVSGKGKGSAALLTLTERSKRYEIIRKIENQTTESVVKELDKLERQYGSRKFRELFKTITCDNGSEFMNNEGMEKSCITRKARTEIFYAHPYSSFERGSNENANGIIRRFLPKGTALKNVKKETINWIQNWMNNYPRKILGGLSAIEAFQATMAA